MLGSFSGGGLGMGIAFSLYDDFTNTANEIERSMGGLGATAEATAATVNASMNMMFVGAGLVAAGFAALVPVGMGIKIAGEFEQARVGLETFLGTKKAADEAFKNIQADAKLSATFDTQGLLAVNRALISAGMSAQAARIDTNNLANAVAAVGGGNSELQRMAVNMQQIKNVGKASALDIKQFAYAGINIYGLLAAYTGKTKEEAKDLTVTYEMLSGALAKAGKAGGLYFGAAERQAHTINGLLSNIGDSWKFFLAGIGDAVHDDFEVIIGWVQKILTSLQEFTNSPIGKWIVRITAYTALLAIGFGILLIVVALARVAVYKLAGAFGDATKAEILQTIAQKGVIAGFREMAVAAWASLGPYVLIAIAVVAIIAAFVKLHSMLASNSVQLRNWAYAILFMMGPVGWLIGGIMALVQGVKDFDGMINGTTKRLTGVMGFFQQLGGVIRGVMEIFSTYDQKTNTFSLSDKLSEGLKKLGILDFVISLGTYIARLMALWQGFKEGVKEAFKIAKEVAVDFLNAVSPASDELHNWSNILSKATSNMETWHKVGKYLGMGLLVIFAEMAIILTVMAVAAAVAGVAMVLAFAGPLAVVYLLYRAISYVIDRFNELREAGHNVFTSIVLTILSSVFYLLTFVPRMFFKVGVAIGSAIWDGLKAIGPSILHWLGQLAISAGNAMLSIMTGGALGGFGFGDDDPAPKPAGGGGVNNNSPFNPFTTPKAQGNISTVNKYTPMVYAQPDQSQGQQAGPQQIVIPIHIGNDQIGEHVIDYIQGKESRKN